MENMKIGYFQRGFNYSQDGPGNRLVYHLQGCNMHCPWCSNPEGMDMFSNSKEIESDELVKDVLSCKPMMFEGGGVTFTGGEATLQIKQLVPVFKKLRENGVTIAIETNGTVCDLSKYAELCDYWMIDFKSPLKEKLEKVTGVSYDILKQNILNLGNPEKYAPNGVYIMRIHGTFVNFLDLSPTIQQDIINRLDPKSTGGIGC